MLYDVRKSFREVLANDGSSWQGWWNAEFSPVFISRLISSIMLSFENSTKTEAPKGNSFTNALEDLKRKYPRLSPEGSCPSKLVPNMFELTANIFKRSRPARHHLSPQDFDSVFSLLSANIVTFYDSTDPISRFIFKVNMDKKLCSRIEKYFQGRLFKAKFHGLFPLASKIIHSCKGNVELTCGTVENRPGIAVKAAKDIEAKEKLSMSVFDI